MLMDYHIHSVFSGDGESPIEELCLSARKKGIAHFAITDHHDIDYPKYELKNISRYTAEAARCKDLFPMMDVAIGLEMDYRPETWERMRVIPAQYHLDFALLSLHYIDNQDPYLPEYFEGRSQREGYSLYLQRLAQMISDTEGPWVLGHITYVSKFVRTYNDPLLRYAEYSDELDEILHRAVAKGYGLEVNASGIKNQAGLLPNTDVLKRYRELGGEIITVGSDAHAAQDVGRWIPEALAAVKDAGFRYISVFHDLKPQFIPIDEVL